MTIIPQGSLSRTELRMLGNNLVSRPRRDPELGAANRSIAMHGEKVDELALPAFVPARLIRRRHPPRA